MRWASMPRRWAMRSPWLGEIGRARDRAQEALLLLKPRSEAWYEAAGIVAEAHGRVGEKDKLVSWAEELLLEKDNSPSGTFAMSGSRAVAMVRTAAQLLATGDTELVERFLAALVPYREAFAANAPSVAGWIDYVRAIRAVYAGDTGDAIAFIRLSSAAFERGGDLRNACMQKVRLGYTLSIVGMHAGGELALREALADAEAMGLRDTISLAKHNLGLALLRGGRLEEAERQESQALRDYVERGDLRLAGASHLYLAMIYVDMRRFDDAERHVREAIAMQSPTSPAYAEAMATLGMVLLGAGRVDEALGAASEGYAAFDRIGEVEDAEALIHLANAEALWVGGQRAKAREAITKARDRILERAAKIHDVEVRRNFLENEPDIRRTLEHHAAWGAAGTSINPS